jgi:VPDSG-CTERM motif
MDKIKYTVLLVALCAGMTSLASATLTGPIMVDTANSSVATELAAFQTTSGDTDATMCLEQVGTAGTFDLTGGGTVTITLGQEVSGQNNVTVTFDLTGTGQVICGFLVKDGNAHNAFIYTVSADEGTTGTFTLLVPLTGSGQFGTLSHLDIFCCPGGTTGVPDGGTTVMLLGAGLTGLGVVRRFLKR